MAYTQINSKGNHKGYDPDKDYSKEIEKAKAQGKDTTKLEQERAAKIADKYGGKEPTMYGSNKTYSQLSSERASGNSSAGQAISSAVSYGNNANTKNDPWTQYAGTNFHQDAIYAAQDGDWDAVIDFLSQREDKVAAQGDNRGKTSAEIYAELWELYGEEPPVAPSGGGGFSYDVSKPSYNDNGLDDRINAMLDQILNREGFSYNAENDALYQQYQKMYNREGNRAMNDTLASAAANAGGMNSYAITAAQQANNYYATQLGDKIPELYQLAYEMYLQDIDNQMREMGLLQQMDDTQYNRYRDTMSDWYKDRDFAYGQYRDDVADGQWRESFDYGVSQDAIDNQFRRDQFDWTVSTDNRDYNYQVGRDAVEDEHYDDQWEHQLAQDALAAEQWDQAFDLEKQQYADSISGGGGSGGSGGGSSSGGSSGGSGSGKGSGGSGNGSGGYAGNDGIDAAIIAKMQEVVGATPDGKWGSNSKAAAGGLSASEAYKAYKAGTLAPAGSDDYEITNTNGDGWVHVQGFGRMTYTELYNYVESGKIKETVNKAKGTITYTKA